MGRKKIEMKYIADHKDRAITFAKRKHGLLKKAAELSILCGLRVNLLFSDIHSSTFHVFNNDCEYKIDYEQFMKENLIKETCTFNEYTIFDYPFDDISNHPKYSTIALENPLSKRPPQSAPTLDDIKREDMESHLPAIRYVDINGMTQEQRATIDAVVADLDTLLRSQLESQEKRKKSEVEVLTLIAGKQLVMAYFNFTERLNHTDDYSGLLLRQNIGVAAMASAFGSLLFLEAENKMTKLKILVDSLVGLLVNPSGFNKSTFGAVRSGKSVIAVFTYLIASVLQQIRMFDTLYSGEMPGSVVHSAIVIDNIKYVERVVDSMLNIMAFSKFKFLSGKAIKLESSSPPRNRNFQASGEFASGRLSGILAPPGQTTDKQFEANCKNNFTQLSRR